MRVLATILFFVVFFGLILFGHVYAYRRLWRDATSDKKLRRVGRVAFAAMFGLFLATVLSFRVWPEIPQELAVGGWIWLGFLLYACLAAALLSIGKRVYLRAASRRTPVSEERRQFLQKAVATTAFAAAGGVTSLGVYQAFHVPAFTDVQVKLPNLPKALDGFTLLQLSDVHIGSVIRDRFIDEVVQRCQAKRPDAVVVTGDLVDGSVEELGRTAARLMRMQSRFGTFFITGNHEYYSGDEEWCRALSEMGVTVLRNRHVPVGDASASIDLIGVDDWSARGGRRGYDLDTALKGRDAERASVLFAHQPAGFDDAVKRGVGLQLSGHTHGGQLFPFTTGVDLVWKYSVGRYDVGRSTLYVSRGTGFWGPPLRVGSPPEITRVTLLA